MKRLALLTATILATALGLLLIWMLGEVLGLFFTSVALAAGLRPLIAWLKQRGISEGWAILICYAGIVSVLGGLGFLYGSLLGSEVAVILDRLPQWYETTRANLIGGVAWQQVLGGALPPTNDLLAGVTGSGVGLLGYTLLGITSSLFSQAIFVIGVLSLAYYWLVDQNRFERLWLSLLPVPTRVRSRSIWRSAEHEIGTYVRAETFIVILVSLIIAAAYTFIGIPFPTLLGLATGAAQLIPWLGGPLLILVATVGTLVTRGPETALAVLCVGVVVELALAFVLRPRLYSNAQNVNSLLVVLLLLVLGTLAGPLAVLFAPPLAALIQVVYRSLALDPQRLARTQSVPELERLADRAEALSVYFNSETEGRPELRSIIQRVHAVVERAQDAVAARS